MDLLKRQSDLLRSEIQDTDFNPVFVIVYEAQSIDGVIKALKRSARCDSTSRMLSRNYLINS
jgi:hypothetical protein